MNISKDKSIRMAFAVATISFGLFSAAAANADVISLDSWSNNSEGIVGDFGNRVKSSFEDMITFYSPVSSFGKNSNNFVDLTLDNGTSLEAFELWGDGKMISSGTQGDAKAHLSFSGNSNFSNYSLKLKGFNIYGDGSYCGKIVISPVPEPQTYAMILIGLGLVGFSARRRKRDAEG